MSRPKVVAILVVVSLPENLIKWCQQKSSQLEGFLNIRH